MASTTFEIDINAQADSVQSAAAKLAELGKRLASAGEASAAAAQALKAGEAAYRVAEISADRTAKALEKVALAAEAQRGKLKVALDAGDTKGTERARAALEKLEGQQTELANKSNAAKSALAAQAAALDKLKSSAAAAEEAEANLAKKIEVSNQELKRIEEIEGTGNLRDIAVGLGALGGPLGSAGQRALQTKIAFDKLGASLGATGPYVAIAVAAVAVVVGIAAITTAAIAGVARITAWAIGLADVARSNQLLAQGIAKSVAGGSELDRKISSLAGKVPQTRGELLQLASSLAKAGYTGEKLSQALENAAIKAAKAKFGPDWQKQLLSVDGQTSRLKANFGNLFGGLKIDKLLEQLSTLTDLFDENMASGKAIKVVFESLFQPLVDGTTSTIPRIRSAFLQFEIFVLKTMIAIKPWGSTILTVAKVLGVLAALIMGAVVVAIGLVVIALAEAALWFGVALAVIVAIGAAIVYVAKLFSDLQMGIYNTVKSGVAWLVTSFEQAIDFLRNISLVEIGRNMIEGLAGGIKAAAGSVADSLENAVNDAVVGAKRMLGIASASKKLKAEVGYNMGLGVAGGLDESAAEVQSSFDRMVTPSRDALDRVGSRPTTRDIGERSGGASNFQGAVFNFYGVEGMDDAEARFAHVLEGYATQLGAEVPG
ncbi:MAG: hypothetical protein FWD69_10515 [Polyangiaceae bacterium]|nr:hypothetical protein [Polyangiaceae bacterium]